MAATFRFLATESERDAVLDWFRGLPNAPRLVATRYGAVLHFTDVGPLVGLPGPVEATKSPIVTVFVPRRCRGVLLTAGEVHFHATPLRNQFPALYQISRKFARWLQQFDRVFSRGSSAREWDYYLEGSLRNFDSDIFALPEAMTCLRRGQYFISDGDTDSRIDDICRALHLRGVQGIVAG